MNKKKINLNIVCDSQKKAEIVKKTLEPENKLLINNTKIKTQQFENVVIITIKTTTKLSSLRYTMDDILFSLKLVETLIEKLENRE